ncbi:MAG: S9 family peptidase, partial [Pseudomonadota bacterium]
MTAALTPPVAKREPKTSMWHGETLTDDYAWLRADNGQDVMRDPSVLDADIRAHLDAENAFTKSWLADTEGLQETLFNEMKGRIKEDDSSVPSPDGPWAYYTRFETGQQYPIVCRRTRDAEDNAQEQVMLNGNVEAEGKSYWKLTGFGHSRDHSLAFYDVDENGSEFCRLRIRDLESGRDLADVIEDVGSVAWSAD